MHDEPPTEHLAYAMPSSTPPAASLLEPPTPGQWAIGIGFVLAALALVAWIGWTVATL